jgi:DNA adenine methylase
VSQETLPFLKWAGGKRWASEKLANHLPSDINRYFEPFLGGGALFFSLRPDNALLTDLNAALIQSYSAIKSDWRSVERHLRWFHQKQCRAFYYEQRARRYRDISKEAARFIYLNRSCWNGLYRENLAGTFNVPIGTKQNIILPTDNFEAVASALSTAELRCSDFEAAIDAAGDGDVVYADPPYTTAHNFNGFVKYNQKIFCWADQVRLKNACQRALLRGAHVLISNADHESVRALYSDFTRTLTLTRASVIASQSQRRGRVDELLIVGNPS